jgi:hypothetical protein
MVRGEGGALDAEGRITLDKCTVDHNVAPYTSGVRAWDRVDLHESTISGNLAQHGAAVFVHFSSARYFANIYNSSIAFNHSETEGDAAVIVKGTPPAGILTLYSSIIANNTSGAGHSPADLTVDALFSGSSPNSGESRSNLQEEVFVVTEAIGHPFDDLDLVVDPFDEVGAQGIATVSEDA